MLYPVCHKCRADAAYEILYSTQQAFGVGYLYYCLLHSRILIGELRPLQNRDIDRWLITRVPRRHVFGYAEDVYHLN